MQRKYSDTPLYEINKTNAREDLGYTAPNADSGAVARPKAKWASEVLSQSKETPRAAHESLLKEWWKSTHGKGSGKENEVVKPRKANSSVLKHRAEALKAAGLTHKL